MSYSIPAMTSLSIRVLRLLADGDFHSGAQIARELGVTRGTIWNAVQLLEGAGLEIYSVPGRGYRLSSPLSLLAASRVVECTGDAARHFAIEVVDVVDSTNDLLMQRARAGAVSGTLIAAEWQASGRGRMGRVWHAGLGEALMFSLLWRFDAGAGGLAGLSLAAGVALARALEKLGARDVALKWPNDVVWRGAKVAGMLIELQGDALGPSAVVIGIGINVQLSERTRACIDQPSADLQSACGRTPDRNEVLGAVLSELAPVLENFAIAGFVPLKAEWERRHVHQDQNITVKLPDGRSHEGIARGVGDDGALLFESGNALRRLHSAELSVRGRA